MFNKIFYFIKRHKNKGKCTLKQEKGISLVEVIVAIVIISIITVVLVRGTMTAVMLIANNKVETKTNTFLRGSTVSRSLVLGQYTEIHYETGIGEYLTAAIPGFGEKMITTMNWQEIIAD